MPEPEIRSRIRLISSGKFLPGQLRNSNLPVHLAAFHQFLMSSGPGQFSFIQDQDPVGVQYGADPLGHDDRGDVARVLMQSAPQRSVGL